MTFEEKIKHTKEVIMAAEACIEEGYAYLDEFHDRGIEFQVEVVSYCSCCPNELKSVLVSYDQIEQKLKELNNEK